jgi:hypothetical protein
MTTHITKRILLLSTAAFLLFLFAAYMLGTLNPVPLASHPAVVQAAAPEAAYKSEGTVPKSYGHLVTAIADRIGTGLVFEAPDGTIRFVSITGMKEGQLARYDQTPTHGGIPKSYGHLVSAVVNAKGTGLIFEDAEGTIRFVTLTGESEGELKRE